jgi:hypothetical protein
MSAPDHRFFVCRVGRPVASWDPPAATDETGHDVSYFGHALAVASAELAGEAGLTFILTWHLDQLPETGSHVVAIVQGDEAARIPAWSNEVLITFKCYGVWPHWMPFFPGPGLTEALEVAHFARRVLLWLPGAARRCWPLRGFGVRPPIYPVPLGYYNQLERPLVPFAQRKWSVSFAGGVALSAGEPGARRRRLATPKDTARREMLNALDQLARALPHEPVAKVLLPHFPALLPGQDKWARTLTEDYSELLAQTRVCLVPRGNSPETFRFFEALRAGCVVVCESLPDHWFYRGAPVVRLRRWDQLEDVLGQLLDDNRALEQLHTASLEWWKTRCSENALGQFMAAKISAALYGEGGQAAGLPSSSRACRSWS